MQYRFNGYFQNNCSMRSAKVVCPNIVQIIMFLTFSENTPYNMIPVDSSAWNVILNIITIISCIFLECSGKLGNDVCP